MEKKLPSENQVEQYDMLDKLLDSIYNEIKDLSKKKPDEHLNELKVKMINRLLKQVKELLITEKTKEFLDLLDEEMLPSNSDAILVISQHRSSMKQFKKLYYGWSDIASVYKWSTKENSVEFD